MKFSIKDFFSKFDQSRGFLRIWSHLLKKSLMENLIFYAVKPFGGLNYNCAASTTVEEGTLIENWAALL